MQIYANNGLKSGTPAVLDHQMKWYSTRTLSLIGYSPVIALCIRGTFGQSSDMALLQVECSRPGAGVEKQWSTLLWPVAPHNNHSSLSFSSPSLSSPPPTSPNEMRLLCGRTKRPITRKLVVCGDGACGKTSLLNVFSRGYFPQVQKTKK